MKEGIMSEVEIEDELGVVDFQQQQLQLWKGKSSTKGQGRGNLRSMYDKSQV